MVDMNNTNPALESVSTPCPDCRGTGSVSVAVQWSDGLGMSSATCGLCEGAKSFPCAPQHLASHLADKLLRARRLAAEALESLTRLRTDVLCYLTTAKLLPSTVGADASGHPVVPGFPGASPYAETWLDALRAGIAPWARTRQAETERQQIADHEAGHHARAVPSYACPATNARLSCKLCRDAAKRPMTADRLQDIVSESFSEAVAAVKVA